MSEDRTSDMTFEERIEEFRDEFPHLNERLYLNHGRISPVPRSVIEASVEGAELAAQGVLDSEFEARAGQASQDVCEMAASLLGSAPTDIALVPNTSTALSLVACAIPWRAGDNVVTSAVENPANVVPWLNLAEMGVEVRFLPDAGDDQVDLSALAGIMDSRTRLVALSLVQFAGGQRLDLAVAADLCRSHGALVCVDAVQAVGALPVDVRALGVHFLAAGAHKWLMGPMGIGLLYVEPGAAASIRPPLLGESNVAPDWRTWEENRTTDNLTLKRHDGAARFEAGPRNVAAVCALRQVLSNIEACADGGRPGIENISRGLHALTDRLVDGLHRLDCRVASPRGDGEWSGLVSFEPPTRAAAEVVLRLAERKVAVALRKGRVRVSPHYYNTETEIDRLLEILRGVI